ncbi:MAG: rhamnulokinase family protein [Ignavibacteriaceae bacterium]
MSVSKFVAVDLGAESGRVIIGILEDEKIHIEEIHRFPNKQINKNGSMFWNVPDLFKEIKTGFSLAVKRGHKDIESIGIDTWGVDFGLIGKNDKLLELPHTYRDNRTNGIPEKVYEKISPEDIYNRTGIQFMQINSLYQLYSIKLSNESLLRESGKLLFMPDLFNFLLTGEKKSEYTIASTSQFLNAVTKQFDPVIFSSLGLPINIMAPIIQPGTVIGKLLPDIAAETGLNIIDVIAVGCHDTASAVAAVPGRGDDWAYLSSGTWSLLGLENDQPVINYEFRDFTNEGGINNKIRFLQNISGLWILQEIKKSWEKKGEHYSYEEITRFADKSDRFLSIINPDDSLFINPTDMIQAISEYCIKTGQRKPKTKGEYSRSVLESLALKYKSVLQRIEKVSKKNIQKLHIVGGGSQNILLNQFAADATGKKVITGPVEATALGNIMVQAVTKGKIESYEKAREIISESFPVKVYEPEEHEKWGNISIDSY